MCSSLRASIISAVYPWVFLTKLVLWLDVENDDELCGFSVINVELVDCSIWWSIWIGEFIHRSSDQINLEIYTFLFWKCLPSNCRILYCYSVWQLLRSVFPLINYTLLDSQYIQIMHIFRKCIIFNKNCYWYDGVPIDLLHNIAEC